MDRMLRIAVADDELDMQQYFAKMLPRLGHQVISVAGTGRQLVDQVRRLQPDIVITDIKMPEMDGIQAAVTLYQDHPVPVILVSAYHDPELVERAQADHVMAYLVKPIKHADLEPAIALAMCRFEQFQAVQQEATDLRQAFENRKIIEQAKAIIMQQSDLDESSAFQRLRLVAQTNHQKLVERAQEIVRGDLAAE